MRATPSTSAQPSNDFRAALQLCSPTRAPPGLDTLQSPALSALVVCPLRQRRRRRRHCRLYFTVLLPGFDALQVTCGSVIKLEADKTRHVLHSHEVSYGYGRGSGQQSVTGYPEKDQAGSMWIVRADNVSGAGPVTIETAPSAGGSMPSSFTCRLAQLRRAFHCQRLADC